jgi:hypothetical protein
MNSTETNKFGNIISRMNNETLKNHIKKYNNRNVNNTDISEIKRKVLLATRGENQSRQQAGTLEKYLQQKVKDHFGLYNENKQNKVSIARTRVRRKTEDFLPWPLVKLTKEIPTNIKNLETIKNTTVPSLISDYTLSYIENTRFPTVMLKSIGGVKLRSSYVGTFCKQPGSQALQGFCDRKETFKVIGNNSTGLNVYKKQMRGLSIGDVTKLVKKSTNPRIFGDYKTMALMYELKRVGDASQIYYAKQINSTPKIITIKPNDISLMRSIQEYSRGNRGNNDVLRKILLSLSNNQSKNFYYKNALFWSNDRPACMLAYILGVPFVLRPTGGPMWFVQSRNFNNNIKTRKGYNDNTILGQIFSGSDEKMWIRKLSIIDTYHDFASSLPPGKFVRNRTTGEYSTDSLARIFKEAFLKTGSMNTNVRDELEKFIDDNFTSKSIIKQYEQTIGDFLKSVSVVPEGITTVNELESKCKSIFGDDKWKRYCVIHDAGVIGGTFAKRRAMSPAIIFDPATSKLNVFNTANSNTRNNGTENKVNKLNEYNKMRANNIRALR